MARPLADELRRRGLRVWYDEFELKVGDSLRASIEEGLARSHHGVVILSGHFFAKKWPPQELNGLVALETTGRRRILPVWHNVDQAQVAAHSPILADRFAARGDQPIDKLADELIAAMDFEGSESPQDGRVSQLALSPSPSQVMLHLVPAGAQVIEAFIGKHEYTVDVSDIPDDQQRAEAASILDELKDTAEIWAELSIADRERAKSRATELMLELLNQDLLTQVGHYERTLSDAHGASPWHGVIVRVAPAAVIAHAQRSSASAPSARAAADQAQLDNLLSLLTRPSMRLIEDQDFASPWPSRITTPLMFLVNEYDEVEHQFDDEELEARRQHLVQAANQFLYRDAKNGFVSRHIPNMRDAGYTPAEVEGDAEREQLLNRRQRALSASAGDLLKAYNDLVSAARKKGYSLETIDNDRHPRVGEHDAHMDS